jgi:hypothetical protein
VKLIFCRSAVIEKPNIIVFLILAIHTHLTPLNIRTAEFPRYQMRVI